MQSFCDVIHVLSTNEYILWGEGQHTGSGGA